MTVDRRWALVCSRLNNVSLRSTMPRTRTRQSLSSFSASTFQKLSRRLLSVTDRDLSLAKRELCWLTDAARKVKDGTTRPGKDYFRGWEKDCQTGEPSFSSDDSRTVDRRKHVLGRLKVMLRDRIVKGMPLQYVIGTQPFGKLDIIVKPPILIPRWETEEWVLRLADVVSQKIPTAKTLRILDLCTGTGCIALSFVERLSKENREGKGNVTKVEVVGVDIEAKAVNLARLNAMENGIPMSQAMNGPTSKLAQCEFLLADATSEAEMRKLCHANVIADRSNPVVEGSYQFDLIVSNPPYVTFREYEDDRQVGPQVRLWEDKKALVADQDGMAIHERIAEYASRFLLRSHLPSPIPPETNANDLNEFPGHGIRDYPIPELVMEIGGNHQVEPLTEMLKGKGFQNVRTWQDGAGKDRVILASR